MKQVPVPVQRGDMELVLTKLPLEPQPEYVLWFYHHMRRLGFRTYPSVHEGYHMGYFWLRKARRLYPERRYRFALGEPVYVALEMGESQNKEAVRNKASFLTLAEAQARVQEWGNRPGEKAWNSKTYKDNSTRIVIGYEWVWHHLKP